MRPTGLHLLPLLLLTGAAAAQDSARFRYRAGDTWVAVEHVLHRESDARIGFAIATSRTVERRYTVLAVDEAGAADVLVEEVSGPQVLHDYVVRGRDERAKHLAEGFDAQSTERHRVLTVQFPSNRFRCEPSRDEPSVYYLQEIPELLGHVLVLPEDDGERRIELPRIAGDLALDRRGNVLEGRLAWTIRDPRVRGGEPVVVPDAEVRWEYTAELGLPRSWRIRLQYPRFPIDRPNEMVVTGELFPGPRLNADELEALRAEIDAHAAVRDAFFAGRFATALAEAERFADAHPGSRLAPAIAAEVEAFHRQVPRYGAEPPALPVAAAFGGETPDLAALRGRVVVLDFWAVWCTPCVAGMAELMELEEHHGGDVVVLGLTREDRRQSTADVREFFESGYAAAHDGQAVTYPLVVLSDDRLHEYFGITAIPKLVVLGRDGRILWEQTGTGGAARLARIVAAAVAR